MKVAIVGGGGCFALNFATHLAAREIEHFGIGRSKKLSPFWQITHHYPYTVGHLVTDLPFIMAKLDTERPDIVVNYAAQGEGAASFGANAPDFFETNCVALSKFVLECQKRDYIRRFIHIGSSEVYGSPDEPAKETDPLWPTSPYSVSKAAFDLYLQSMHRTQGFAMNIVRPSNCYVEGQQIYRVIPKTIICAMTGKKLQLHGGGKAEKSYLHASDLSRAVMRIIEQGQVGLTYNVGPDKPISIRELVQHVAAACGKEFSEVAEDAPDRVGQDSRYYLDMTRIKALGWSQQIGMTEGLLRMVAWVRRYPELLTMPTTYEHRK